MNYALFATPFHNKSFDNFANEKNNPSLDRRVEMGENLIEFIPLYLVLFKKERIRVVSDIKKALLQIKVYIQVTVLGLKWEKKEDT